jgi:hypothetical protein
MNLPIRIYVGEVWGDLFILKQAYENTPAAERPGCCPLPEVYADLTETER